MSGVLLINMTRTQFKNNKLISREVISVANIFKDKQVLVSERVTFPLLLFPLMFVGSAECFLFQLIN